ncbi:MAG: histidine phosphatase family protein [Proteobacteria bacterium]|nr:histidine phosphatase family protein [Pseudomonadota bacterium]MBU1648085.1 histidine phosphatase family protein [Pseudomonadota bacterium]
MKNLFLVRHAKSSWADPSLADRERPLNKRGLRDAPLMGQRLAGRKVRVDAIWSSPAQRALETARFFASTLKYPRKEIELRDRLYTNTIDDLLLEIRSCPDEIKSLLVVGHNPVISGFANFLIGHAKDTHIESIPTCGIVAINFQRPSWQLLKEHEGRFLFFDYPKKDVTPL